jgi:hypothetical protein
MQNCNPCLTPVDTKAKPSASSGTPLSDTTHYRSIAVALQYLTLTQPEILLYNKLVCSCMTLETHLQLLKRILRYVQGTLHRGLHLHKNSSRELVAYLDTDWVGCPDTCRSTSRYCVFLGSKLVAWSSKWQHTVSRSSAEAEYKGVTNAVAEVSWLPTTATSWTESSTARWSLGRPGSTEWSVMKERSS